MISIHAIQFLIEIINWISPLLIANFCSSILHCYYYYIVTLWSDHCELQAELATKKRSSLGNTKPIKSSKSKKYRWENTSK